MNLNKTEYIKLYDEVGRLSDSITIQALKIRSLSNEIDELGADLTDLKFYVLEGVYSLYDFRYELLEEGLPVEKIDTMDIVALPQKNITIAGNREDIEKMKQHDKKVSVYNSDLDKLKNDAETFKRKAKALDEQTSALIANGFSEWSFTAKEVATIKGNIRLARELARNI